LLCTTRRNAHAVTVPLRGLAACHPKVKADFLVVAVPEFYPPHLLALAADAKVYAVIFVEALPLTELPLRIDGDH
jgi:hypothetical protein